MDQMSSSKVTVEYYDPYNVYQLLSPGLLPRLPLRSLHWESHAGPLRSIQTLHVDLVPAELANSLSGPTSSDASELAKVKSNDPGIGDGFQTQSLGAAAIEGKPQGKARRHQIPGLHQTPYLKILFLRCDDNETYKASARKEVREWVKEHVPQTESTTKEGHDAFEWLIVHVVVPNTAASTQPKTAAKGPTPLLEKLKNDFNSSSKNTIDRIAQIRIGINDVPYDILPRVVPAIPGSYNETPKEHQESWTDLIAKLKALILSSFDLRVSQYEENIKEKDGQRGLPGWNFCTFFILKESLARGFESVGLVEDALVGYDELSLRLDAFTREQASTGSGVAFLPYTDALRIMVESTKAAIIQEQSVEKESDGTIDSEGLISEANPEIPLSATNKNYRDLVLANDISIFDFRCYMFARQLSLLLRLANATISTEKLLAKLKEQQGSTRPGLAPRKNSSPKPPDETENLMILSQICQRALAFITSISQIMRIDMEHALLKDSDSTGPVLDTVTNKAINNIVSSFTFSVAQQILVQTSSKSLPIPEFTANTQGKSGQEPKSSMAEPKTMLHPARSTSLMATPFQSKAPSSPNLFPGASGARRASMQDGVTVDTILPLTKAGLEDLAAHRSELYLLSRGVLERLGTDYQWSAGWARIQRSLTPVMKDISLSEDAPDVAGPPSVVIKSSRGMSNPILRNAFSSEDAFYTLYETLTDKALRHFSLAGHKQSVQAAMADLAILKYYLKDFAAAASYFYRMTPFFGDQGWEHIEMNMLEMYAQSLRELNRVDEYIKVVLKLLSTAAAHEKDRIARKSQLGLTKGDLSSLDHANMVKGYLPELMSMSKNVKNDIVAPLQGIFSSIKVKDSIIYHTDKDSFYVSMTMQYLLVDALSVDKIRVRLSPILGGQSRDIWLEAHDIPTLQPGEIQVDLLSMVIIPGTYIVKEIVFRANKLIFSYDVDATAALCSRSKEERFLEASRLTLYQRPKALDIRLSPSRLLYFQRTQALEVSICSGWNSLESGELHIRAATAGLRLKSSELSILSGNMVLTGSPEPGIIKFGVLPANQVVRLRIPFNIENDVSEISIKCEISFTTSFGVFFFANQLHMPVKLPLGVSVTDIFKHQALFSRFSITTSTNAPLRVLGSKLEGSEIFEATKGNDIDRVATVFDKQPATVLYKITKKATSSGGLPEDGTRNAGKPLSLSIYYVLLTEELEEALAAELESQLAGTKFEPYLHLIKKVITHEFSFRCTSLDYERMALLNEISTAVVSDVQWTIHFVGLGRDEASKMDMAVLIQDWITKWLHTTPRVRLSNIEINNDTIEKARCINIPVSVPPVTVVHTADLILSDPEPSSSPAHASKTFLATTNQALSATLTIKSTRAWDTKSPPPLTRPKTTSDGREEETEPPLQFIYELTAPPDTWLVGGKRRGQFNLPSPASPTPSATQTFPILLIPIKEGYLPYPNLEIHAVQPLISRPKSKGSTHSGSSETAPSATGISEDIVSCEVDWKCACDFVRVIGGHCRTTVSLDASGPLGGAWLLETERSAGVGRDLF